MISKQQEIEVKKFLLSKYPEEAVCAITEFGFEKLENIAEEPTKNFKISKEQNFKIIEKGLKLLIHSHPDWWNVPSKSDMNTQMSLNIPMAICTVTKNSCSNLRYFGIKNTEPLIGRPFVHGITDCYAIIRDFYISEFNEEIKNYARSWEWWLDNENLYENNLKDCGFYQVYKPTLGDMFLCKIKSKVYNHAGIYLGNELILHHLSGYKPIDNSKISRKEPINRWLKFIEKWYRHEKINPSWKT